MRALLVLLCACTSTVSSYTLVDGRCKRVAVASLPSFTRSLGDAPNIRLQSVGGATYLEVKDRRVLMPEHERRAWIPGTQIVVLDERTLLHVGNGKVSGLHGRGFALLGGALIVVDSDEVVLFDLDLRELRRSRPLLDLRANDSHVAFNDRSSGVQWLGLDARQVVAKPLRVERAPLLPHGQWGELEPLGESWLQVRDEFIRKTPTHLEVRSRKYGITQSFELHGEACVIG